MIKFLLQTVNGKVRHDFVFEMEHAIDYYTWKEPGTMTCKYISIEQLEEWEGLGEYIPVGTIEFVYKFIDTQIKTNGSKEICPLNVPVELFPYAGRNIYNFSLDSVDSRIKVYEKLKEKDVIWIKSNDQIKSPNNGPYSPQNIIDKSLFPDGEYQISEDVDDLVSEYRCFVYNDRLVGIQYYSGEFTCFPDVSQIMSILTDYQYSYGYGSAPQAFTLDVGVTKTNKTIVMEVHEFYSCGLYGFSDYNVLPYMFVRTFNDIKKRILPRNDEKNLVD